MKRIIIFSVLVLIVVAQIAFGGAIPSPSTPRLMVDDSHLIDSTHPLPTTSNIGSITVNAFPVYQLGGMPATSTLDSDTRVQVNISSVTVPLPVYNQPITITTGVISVAGTGVTISPIANQKSFRITRIDVANATNPLYLMKGDVATYGESIEFWSGISRQWGVATFTIIGNAATPATVTYELEADQ